MKITGILLLIVSFSAQGIMADITDETPRGISYPLQTPSPTPEIKEFELKITRAEIICGSDSGSEHILALDLNSGYPDQSDIFMQKVKALFDIVIKPELHQLVEINTDSSTSAAPNFKNDLKLLSIDSTFGQKQASIRFAVIIERSKLNDDRLGYRLMSNLKKLVKGKQKPNILFTSVAIANSCKGSPKVLAKMKKPEAKAKEYDIASFLGKPVKVVKKKKNAEVQIDFSLQNSAEPGDQNVNFDITANPIQINRTGFGGNYQISPIFIEFKYSKDPKTTKNSLNIGAKLSHLRVINDDGSQIYKRNLNNRLRYFDVVGFSTVINPKLETLSTFSEATLLLDWKSGLPTNIIQNSTSLLRFEPFIGFESGLKIKREESPFRKERWVVRPKFGASLYLVPFRAYKQTPFVIQVDYTRRLFLVRETFFFKDKDGNEFVDGANPKSPKDHVKAKISYTIGEFFSPFVEYEYGREPPKYFEVNSKFKMGIGFNFNLGLDN